MIVPLYWTHSENNRTEPFANSYFPLFPHLAPFPLFLTCPYYYQICPFFTSMIITIVTQLWSITSHLPARQVVEQNFAEVN